MLNNKNQNQQGASGISPGEEGNNKTFNTAVSTSQDYVQPSNEYLDVSKIPNDSINSNGANDNDSDALQDAGLNKQVNTPQNVNELSNGLGITRDTTASEVDIDTLLNPEITSSNEVGAHTSSNIDKSNNTNHNGGNNEDIFALDDANSPSREGIKIFLGWLLLFIIGGILGVLLVYLLFVFNLEQDIQPVLEKLGLKEYTHEDTECRYCIRDPQVYNSLRNSAEQVDIIISESPTTPVESPTVVPTATPTGAVIGVPVLLRDKISCADEITVDYFILNKSDKPATLDKFEISLTRAVFLKNVYVGEAGLDVGTTEQTFEISDIGASIASGESLKFGFNLKLDNPDDTPFIMKLQAYINGQVQEDNVDLGTACGLYGGKGESFGDPEVESSEVEYTDDEAAYEEIVETPPPTGVISPGGVFVSVVVVLMVYSLVYSDLLLLPARVLKLGPYNNSGDKGSISAKG